MRIGDTLIAAGKVDVADLERALELKRNRDEPLGSILVRLGLVAENDVVEMVSQQLGLSVVQEDEYPDEPLMPEHFSVNFLKFQQVVPLAVNDGQLELAMVNPLDAYVIHAVELTSDLKVKPRLAAPTALEAAIERLYGSGRSVMDQIVAGVDHSDHAQEEDVEHLKDQASEAPVIRLVNLLIERAVDAGASDIHIEPFDNRLKVRYRVDGMLQEVEAPPSHLSAAVISRFKIMAKLDIAEHRLPQDGRIQLHTQGREIDLRVSTVPTMHGESLVIRLLRKDAEALDFAQLGFTSKLKKQFISLLDQPNGILLVTGPTGSGKTTTLYSALRRLNEPVRKILTVEDPVEYELEGVNQVQVKPQIGLDYARALRAFLRQDPDVIMIGEMRDQETARIAIQSAMTGHLVLSTLHTNDAVSSITRLLDMGIEPYLVTSTVTGVLAQRLARKLCPHCREAYPLMPELAEEVGLPLKHNGKPTQLYRAVGCNQCKGSGYRGRLAVLEVLTMNDELRSQVLKHADAHELTRLARSHGMRSMYTEGMEKVLAGLTTLEEVLRVTRAA